MPTDPQTIRSYHENAEAWAKRQRSRRSKSHSFLEKPAMTAELPDLSGQAVLCLGCGSGEECRMLMDRGAARVVGTDAAKGLIEQARYAYPDVEFEVMDMERLSFPAESFDFIYSSLAMHYLSDWRPTLAGALKVLKPGGRFLFSTHHPVRFASETGKRGEITTSVLGFELSDDGQTVKVHGDYLNPHPVTDQWFDRIRVTYHHKPLADMVNEILETGWRLEKMAEPRASESAARLHPDFYQINQKLPLFVIFKLMKGEEEK